MALQGPKIDSSILLRYVVLATLKSKRKELVMAIGPFESEKSANEWAKRLPNHPIMPTKYWSVVFLHEP